MKRINKFKMQSKLHVMWERHKKCVNTRTSVSAGSSTPWVLAPTIEWESKRRKEDKRINFFFLIFHTISFFSSLFFYMKSAAYE